jgi:hypothetical protein
MTSQTFDRTKAMVSTSQSQTNDGYWVRHAPNKTPFMAYFFPEANTFEALNAYRASYLAIAAAATTHSFQWAQPCEFRLIDFTDKAVLMPGDKRSGSWVNVDILSLTTVGAPDDWKDAMADMETAFRSLVDTTTSQPVPAVPHPGKLFAWKSVPNVSNKQPAVDLDIMHSVYTSTQKSTFMTYRDSKDPNGLFLAGTALDLLA